MNISKWDNRFITLAQEISTWSKDPSRKIGAVIVDQNNHIVGTGYNGFPKGINDFHTRLENKEYKRTITLHAEENAILNARCNVENCTLYVYGLPCCVHCACLIIQSGIKTVYYKLSEKGESEAWKDNIKIAMELFKEANVSIYKIED